MIKNNRKNRIFLINYIYLYIKNLSIGVFDIKIYKEKLLFYF